MYGMDMKESILESLHIYREINEGVKRSERESLVKYLHEFYGSGRRKGLQKYNLSHPLDVLQYSNIEDIEDVGRSLRIYRTSLLHDIIEDSNLTADDLFKKFGLDEKEMDILNLMSRNVKNKDGSDYIQGIMGNVDAVIVKFADRIANTNDLILWVETVRGFTKTSLRMTEKYLKETREMVDIFKEKYGESFKGGELRSLAKQWIELKNKTIELEQLYKKYKGTMIKEDVEETSISENVFKDQDEFDISKEDISKTIDIVKDLYKNNPSLQDAYPDFSNRLKKVIKELEKKIEKHGFEYVQNLFKKVRFKEDDFLSAYNRYIDEQLLEGIKMLQNKREKTPKDGIKSELMKRLRLRASELEDIISGDDKSKLMQIYKTVTGMMDEAFRYLSRETIKLAKNNGGYAKSRPGKFKDPDRAVSKYVKDKLEKKEKGLKDLGDFLDLGDILGFRGVFKDVSSCIDFSLDIIKNNSKNVYKIASFIGKGSAYQGVNMNVNYEGKFNYEVQSVVDKVQIATDLNHDVIYKEMIKTSQKEREAVMMLVQISLGLMFDELFKF